MALVDAALHDLRHLRQLDARVHAQALGGVVGGKRQHGATSVSADLQHVGQIKLALRIIVADLGQRVKQRAGIEAIEPGIALVDGGLLGRGILLFDDALNLARLVADDAAVAGGVVKLHGQHHHGGVVLVSHLSQARDGFRLDKRAVARQNGKRAIETGERIGASQHRTGRAVLHFLHHYLRIAFHQRNNLLARMAYNRSHLRNARSVRGVNNPAHERLAQNLVCDLGLFRLHAGTGTRGQNDGGSFHGVPFSRLARKRELSRTAAPQAKPAAPQAIEPQKSIPQRPLTPRRLHAKRTQPLPKRYQRRNSGSERHARSATRTARSVRSPQAAERSTIARPKRPWPQRHASPKTRQLI